MKNYIENLVKDYWKNKFFTLEKIQEFVQNEEFSIEDRWNIFCLSKLGFEEDSVHSDSLNFIFGGEVSPYDDLYMERYQAKTAEQIINILEDKEIDNKLINSVKEEFMQKFTWIIINDW